jgi:hypothetical protein
VDRGFGGLRARRHPWRPRRCTWRSNTVEDGGSPRLRGPGSEARRRWWRPARRRSRGGTAAEEADVVLCRAGGQRLGKSAEGDGDDVSFASE